MATLQVLLQRGRRMQIRATAAGHTRHQQVFLVRHACVFIIHHFAIAVESQAVLHVAPYTEDGDGLISRRQQGQPIGQRITGTGIGSPEIGKLATALLVSAPHSC